MSGPDQLPHLLRLLDDDSPPVREAVLRGLREFGPLLRKHLRGHAMDDAERQLLNRILEDDARQWLRNEWSNWFVLRDENLRLEIALSLLCDYMSGLGHPGELSVELDRLASECRAEYADPDPESLAEFLFKEKSLRGNRSDYFDPQNSNLLRMLETGLGNPISLSLLYLLVAHRLGFDRVAGCNVPGHFVVSAWIDDSPVVIDCFETGQILRPGTRPLTPSLGSFSIQNIHRLRADSLSIIGRVLRNLVRSFHQSGNQPDKDLMLELLRLIGPLLESRKTPEVILPEIPVPENSDFKPGHLVCHRRYSYRGVVVAVDPECRADELWYSSNATQPDRHQPWYYVLVHESNQITYAAESSLKSDPSRESIVHPLVPYFFSGFEGGVYIRNKEPWLH